MKDLIFTKEELSEIEKLEIKGGKSVGGDGIMAQRGCSNSEAGCGAGVDQDSCSNSAGGCGSQIGCSPQQGCTIKPAQGSCS